VPATGQYKQGGSSVDMEAVSFVFLVCTTLNKYYSYQISELEPPEVCGLIQWEPGWDEVHHGVLDYDPRPRQQRTVGLSWFLNVGRTPPDQVAKIAGVENAVAVIEGLG